MGIRGRVGPGYAQADMSGDAGAAGIGYGLDPNMLRDAMLEGMNQRRDAFSEWLLAKRELRKPKFGLKQDDPRAVAAAGLETARDVAQTQALTGRVPTRMSTVGMQTFATPDPLKMTGAQRMQFLPGNAPTLSSDDAFGAMLRRRA